VQFIDEHEGWAVGDDGVIWHTVDGGQTWERQPTGVRASLRSVCFLDAFTGFVVGRESLPQGTGSGGVILYTNDGGAKWRRISLRELPGLHHVQFLDRRTGFVAGDSSPQFPAGLFITQDGGATWKPVAGPQTAGWAAADFLDSETGVLVGPWGGLAPLRERRFMPPEIDPAVIRGRTIRTVRLQGRSAWAAGDEGLLLVSESTAGKRWGLANLDLPPAVQKCWDFHALHVVGDYGWIVGRPGSVVLHTWDRGKSWQVQATGQPLPLHGVFFLNEKRGWAVGELGTILGTADGGKTWKIQRRGGHRAAVLIVTARAEGLPAGTIAVLGGDEGYLCAAVRVSCADPASAAPGQATEDARLAEAVRLAGGCAGEVLGRFPLPQHLMYADAATFARAWGRSQDEARGLDELERQLVLAIRIWRPDVIITDNPDPRSPTGQSGALVALVTRRAFQRAGQADVYPEQIGKLDLQPWTPSKLYGRWDGPEGATVSLDLHVPRAQLRGSAAQVAGPAWDLLFESGVTPPAEVYYRLLESRLDGTDKHQGLMQGVTLQRGGQARRAAVPEDEREWNRIVAAARQVRDVRTIANHYLSDPAKARQLLGAVDQALDGLPEDDAAEAAFALASLCAQAGQWAMAKEIYLLLVDRYPAHRLAPEACRWLIRYGTSSEARRRDELGQFLVSTFYEFQVEPRARQAPGLELKLPNRTVVHRERETILLRRHEDIRQWFKSGLAVGEHLAAYGPLYGTDPGIQFCLQAAHRALGEFETAQAWYTQFKLHQSDGPWHDAAGSELWLMRRVGLPPKPLAHAQHTAAPPYLDGRLDDACWQSAQPLTLKDAVGTTAKTYPTEAWIAYDTHFLYLALRCRHPAGHHVPPVKPRPRDADLRNFDRVSLLLDLDRDYATCFHYQIDQRGCVCEDCWGDRSWNPKWFVAIHSDETSWQIEASIPLVELTGDRITMGQTWAFNLVRTIPGQGVQSFSTPADATPRPEGMGLLTFVRTESPRQMTPVAGSGP
jgi:photosystem II stability/assembly factor-like uncharacterized protein